MLLAAVVAWTSMVASHATAARDTVLDVPSHLLIGLYREPHHDTFVSKSWLSNTDFSFYWKPDFIWSRAQYQNNPTGFGFALSKELSPSLGMRLGLGYALPRYDNDVYKADDQSYYMRRLSLDLAGEWNLTNFYYGFDKARRQFWSLTLGAQASRTTPSDDVKQVITNARHSSYSTTEKEWSVGGYLGLQYRYILSPRVSLFAEPQLLIMSDAYDAGRNEAGLDIGMSGRAGFNYRLSSMYYAVNDFEEEMHRDKDDDNWGENYFMQLQGGMATSLKANTLGMTPLDRKGGIAFGASVGRWMNPLYGMRFGMFESTYKYALDDFGQERYTQLHGLRGEVVLNPFRLLPEVKSFGRLGADVSAGIEFGGIKKHHGEGLVSSGKYFGPTIGGQLKYFVNSHAAVLLDGRYTVPAYTMEGGSYRDHVAQLGIGMEVYDTNFERYTPLATRDSRPIGQDLRETWFIEFGAGLSHAVHAGENFRDGIDPEVSFGVGRRMNKYMSIRTRGEIIPLRNDTLLKNKPAELIANFSIDFMLTLTNLWMGVDPRRHLDVRLELGQLILLEGLTNLDLGYEMGVQVSKRLSPHWELYFEPRYQVLYDFPSRWDLGAGATYAFAKYSRKQRLGFQRWYIQTLTGAQFMSLNLNNKEVSSQFAELAKLQRGDIEITVGRNMDPVWSLRAGIFGKELSVHDVVAPDHSIVPQTSQYIGGRMEAEFSLLRAIAPKAEKSRWNVSIGAGIEGGHLTNAYSTDAEGNISEQNKVNFGFTMNGQLAYRMMDHTWLVGQLRMQQINLDEAYLPVSGHLGLQYDIHNRKRIDMRRARHRWYMMGGVGMMNGHIGTVDVAAGHNFTPLHGTRIGLTFADSHLRNTWQNLKQWITAEANYTLNMSNLIFGIDDDRRLDISAVAGLNLSIHGLRHMTQMGSFNDILHQDTHLGLDFGAHLQAHIVDGLSLYLEPRFIWQPNDDKLTVEHERLVMATTTGLRIDMNQYGKIRRWKERIGRDYIQTVYHLQPTVFYERGIHNNPAGSGIEVNYGHWFNDLVGVEGGIYYMDYKQYAQRCSAFGTRPAMVIDLASAMNPEWRGRPLGFVATVGANIGQIDMNYRPHDLATHSRNEFDDPLSPYIDDMNVYDSRVWRVAPSGSFQLRYTLPKNRVAFLLGTRFTYYNYPVSVGSTNINRNFIPLSFQAGVQYNIK